MMDLLAMRSYLKTKKSDNDQVLIWDRCRKIWITLYREELLRQCIVNYLIEMKGYAEKCISIEKKINYHSLAKRYDIVAYNQRLEPILLIECKSPTEKLTDNSWKQLAMYQEIINGKTIWLTNGIDHRIIRFFGPGEPPVFLDEPPEYGTL